VEAAPFDDELELLKPQALPRPFHAGSGEVGYDDLVSSHREGEGDGGGNDGGGEEAGGESPDFQDAHQNHTRPLRPRSGALADRPPSGAGSGRFGRRPGFEELLSRVALGAHEDILSRVRIPYENRREVAV
jgi:hypothetical protein